MQQRRVSKRLLAAGVAGLVGTLALVSVLGGAPEIASALLRATPAGAPSEAALQDAREEFSVPFLGGGDAKAEAEPSAAPRQQAEVKKLTTPDKVSIALCTIDLYQATGQLGQAGLGIDALTRTCHQPIAPLGKAKAMCSASVTYLITQLSLLASLLADASNKCALSVNLDARCATDALGLTGLLAGVATHSTNIYVMCKKDLPLPRRMCALPDVDSTKEFDSAMFNNTDLMHHGLCGLGDDDEISAATLQQAVRKAKMSAVGRRLKHRGPVKKLKQWRQAACAFSIMESTAFLSRFGLAMNAAVHTCADGKHQRQCSISVLGVLASLGTAGQYIAAAVANCPVLPNVNALCGAAISGLTGALAGCASFATDLSAAGCAGNGEYVAGQSPGSLPVRPV